MRTETISNITHTFLSEQEFSELVDNAESVIDYCYAKMAYETNIEKSEMSNNSEYSERAETNKSIMESINLTEKDRLFVTFNMASEDHGEILVKQWEV